MPPAAGESTSGASWPPPPGVPLLDAVTHAWKESVFAPRRFFPQLGRGQSLAPSLWYYIAVGLIVSGIGLFWQMVFPAAQPSYLLARMSGTPMPETHPLQDFLLAPLVLMLSLFITAGVVHVMLLMLGGAKNGFATTIRVFCHAYGAQLAAILPFVGGVIGGIWMLALALIGLREAHDTTTARAAVAVLLPAFLLILFGILAALMLMAGAMAL